MKFATLDAHEIEMHALILNYSKCINISVAADDETAPQGNAMHAVPLTLNMNADGFLLEDVAARPDLVCHHGGRIAPFGVRVSPPPTVLRLSEREGARTAPQQ